MCEDYLPDRPEHVPCDGDAPRPAVPVTTARGPIDCYLVHRILQKKVETLYETGSPLPLTVSPPLLVEEEDFCSQDDGEWRSSLPLDLIYLYSKNAKFGLFTFGKYILFLFEFPIFPHFLNLFL